MISLSCVIRDCTTGEYIYTSLFTIATFASRAEALGFIERKRLNTDVFIVEVKYEKRTAKAI